MEPQEWLEQHITVRGVDGTPITSPLAKVWLYTGEYSIPLVVATLETMQDKVLIGRDIGPVFNELFMRELTESESDREMTEVKINEQRMENEQKQKDVVEGVESDKEKHETVVNDGIILVTREQEKKEAED